MSNANICPIRKNMNKLFLISLLIQQKAPWIPVRILLVFFGHFEVRGLENLKEIEGNAIFACNHASEIDIPLLPAAIPFWSHFSPMFYTSRESEFYGGSGWRRHFYGGRLFGTLGSYPVVVGLRDYKKALFHQIRIVNAGKSLCIFPEGRTTPNGMIQPAKGGVAYLAYITNVPIVPVRLGGTFRFSVKGFFMRKIKLSVSFGKPIRLSSKDESSIPIKECKNRANDVMSVIKNMV